MLFLNETCTGRHSDAGNFYSNTCQFPSSLSASMYNSWNACKSRFSISEIPAQSVLSKLVAYILFPYSDDSVSKVSTFLASQEDPAEQVVTTPCETPHFPGLRSNRFVLCSCFVFLCVGVQLLVCERRRIRIAGYHGQMKVRRK